MFCCLTASTARALLCMANAEFGIHVAMSCSRRSFVMSHITAALSLTFLTLTLMIQDSGPSSHRTMFRFSKLKLIGLGGMGMVPIRSLL